MASLLGEELVFLGGEGAFGVEEELEVVPGLPGPEPSLFQPMVTIEEAAARPIIPSTHPNPRLPIVITEPVRPASVLPMAEIVPGVDLTGAATMNAPPNDLRGFIHKRIGRAIVGFATGGPVGAAAGFIGGGGGGGSPAPGVFQTVGPRDAGCPPFMKPHPVTGECTFFLGDRPGPDTFPDPGGNGAVATGRIHAGDHAPFIVDRRTRRCLKGHVLGTDGVCHGKRDIRNSDRLYPKPRRPLGTSGDLNAVTKAASFARRLKSNQKRLKKAGASLAPR